MSYLLEWVHYMKQYKLYLDSNREFALGRYGNGVKLSRPCNKQNRQAFPKVSLSTLLDITAAIYFEDFDHQTIICNEITAEECGFISLKDCIGAPWYVPFEQKSVFKTLQNDRNVVKHESLKFLEEAGVRNDGTLIRTLSVRMPWYNNNNTLIGLFGCSILLGKHSVSGVLSQLHNMGLLAYTPNIAIPEKEVNHFQYLTEREKQCLEFMLDGKSAKEIARCIGISHRTVEQYTSEIKEKFGYKTKYELISNILSMKLKFREN